METRSLTLWLLAQVCCVALAQAQSPNISGLWNIEISFAAGGQHSLRFDAQPDGKGIFVLMDQIAKAWGETKPFGRYMDPGRSKLAHLFGIDGVSAR